MTTFFQGWRRKIGCVTLAMACAFLALWVRSFASTNDGITVWANHSLYSHNGWISWNVDYVNLSEPFVNPNPILPIMKSRWEFWGIVVSDTSNFGNQGVRQYWVTYWYFIAPLTLVSAFLLFSKPRQSRTQAIPQSSARRA